MVNEPQSPFLKTKRELLFWSGWMAASLVFFIAVFLSGGAAQTGKVEAGRLFVSQHGVYREVSQQAYIISAVGTWLWVIYGCVLGFRMIFQTARKEPSLWALLHPVRLFGILLLSLCLLGISWKTLDCISKAQAAF